MKFRILSERVSVLKKFRMSKRKIVFKIKEVPSSSNVVDWLRSAVLQIVTYTTNTISPEDKVGVTFHDDNFKQKLPGWLSFRAATEFTFENVWEVMASVFQSNSEGFSTDTFRMEVTSISPPSGQGRQRVYNSYEEECRQRRGIVAINNTDNLCLPRALVVAKANVDKDPNYKILRDRNGIQSVQAQQLLQEAAVVIPPNGCGIEELRQFQNHLNGYKISVYQHNTKGRQLTFEGPAADKKINLLYHEGHFNVITSLTSAFACGYYCEACHTPYDNKNKHHCGASCPCCNVQPPCEKVQEEIMCANCGRSFRGAECFARHHSVCATVRKCNKCLKTYASRKSPHVCGEIYCKCCQDYKLENHLCYIRPAAARNQKEETLFIFYDLETRQEKEDSPSVKVHEAYLCVFQQSCPLCRDSETTICSLCGVREQILKGPKCLERFTEYVLNVRKKFKKVCVVAHNGQSFDHQFVLNYVLNETHVTPELIMRGSKILMMAIGNVKFIDSLNFFPMALSALPKALGLGEELKKGYFPHLFNTEENASYVGPLPALNYYSPDAMKPDARDLFLKWYDEQDVFDMQRDLVEYCRSDVDILKRACMKFRDMFIKECDVDPFTESITIASACNLMFRRKFLQPDTIGVIPKGGYRRADNQSLVAIQWLVWEEDRRGIQIQHAGRQRELKINGMRVDGYCETTIFEFYGCYYHGCPNCFLTNRNQHLHAYDQLDTMDHRYENTKAKATRLRAMGYEVVEMWECSFKRELKSNPAMQYLRDHPMLKSAPLNPRDAFYGGRTGCTKLKYTAKDGEKIKYVDVCSLYPFICKHGRFPLKHPEVFVGQECKNYIDRYGIPHGVIKCSILAPQNLYHPVLPVKKHNKLMFSLCAKCVEDLTESECSHNPEERTICGTWCSDEIVKALDKGYKLIDVHEMWVYDTTRYDKTNGGGGLFSEFINHFVRIKQQASDWPSSCCTHEQRNNYIEEFFKSEGVQLNYDDVTKNPGLRSLAKLMLNSFWGKFGQRENQSKTTIVRDSREFYDLMWSPSIDVNYVLEVNDETVIMNWQYKEEAVDPLFTVNCVIAAYVTTQARLQLYSYLDLLGERVLYYDTDSVIYISRENQPDLPLGNNLGDLTDEIEGEYGAGAFITEFASGGPKTYGYQVQLPSGKTKTVIKVKGLTLNYQNLEKVNFDSLVDLIDSTDKEIVTMNSVIRRTEDHSLITKIEEKKFRVNVKKRKRIDDYDTAPYGYKR